MCDDDNRPIYIYLHTRAPKAPKSCLITCIYIHLNNPCPENNSPPKKKKKRKKEKKREIPQKKSQISHHILTVFQEQTLGEEGSMYVVHTGKLENWKE